MSKFIAFLSLEDRKGRDKFNVHRFVLFKVMWFCLCYDKVNKMLCSRPQWRIQESPPLIFRPNLRLEGPKRNVLDTPPPPYPKVSILHRYFRSTFCFIIPNTFTSCWSSHVVHQLAISPDTSKKFWRLPLFTIYLSLQGLFRNFDDTFFDLLKPHLERLCIDPQVSLSWLDIS